MGFMKLILGVVMVGVVAVASIMFGMPGFLGGLAVAAFLSFSISKREKEEVEKKRHQEMIDAIAATKGEETK